MARKRNITRTFIKCTILASTYNLNSKEVSDDSFTMYTVTGKNIEDQAEQWVRDNISENEVLLEVTHVESEETKLGLPVEVFVRFATLYGSGASGDDVDDDDGEGDVDGDN